MKFEVRLAESAEADLRDIYDYIAVQPHLAEQASMSNAFWRFWRNWRFSHNGERSMTMFATA